MSEPKIPHITTDDVYGDIGLTDEDLAGCALNQLRSVNDLIRSLSPERRAKIMARAKELIAEQGITLKVGPDAWNKIQEALDAPPRDIPRLKALLDASFFEG
jgi:hypothetical protein